MSVVDAITGGAGLVAEAAVHAVCCDPAVALCGDLLPGADRYATADASCVLCQLTGQLNLPCGAPGCDVGGDELTAELEFTMLGTCRQCGCTDDVACPGGCSWVPDPALRGVLGTLCSACVALGEPEADRG